jgi:two-component system sensor histidine kinase KdpD
MDSTISLPAWRIAAMAKTPEEWLKECDPAKRPAVFKLFLGYAPGVGKTYAMLSEGVRRASRGEEVVIGVVETHGRKPIVELSSRLETVPRKKLEYKATIFEEMDVDAILARKPHVVLVDELAHTNIEGSKHAKRYEDVFELLDAGIDVLSTLNVQHIESLAPTIRGLTGVQVRETVPDWVIRRAGEIVMAQAVDRTLSELKNEDGQLLQVRERIAVCISSNPAAQYLIARGARMAQAMDGDLFVLYIDTGADESDENQRTLADNVRFAESVGAKVVKTEGKVVAEKVAEFVRENHITQVVFGRSATKGWKRYFYLSAIHKFLRDTPAVDVHIVTQEMR